MSGLTAFNFKKWIDENRHLLRPPVGNKAVWTETGDFIVMVVGGPNSRTDFHYNESEEFFYQLEGDVSLRLQVEGKVQEVPLREGDIFLLPARIPHSPQRGPNTVGIVIEKVRTPEMKDGLLWFCPQCNTKLYEEYFGMTNIATQMQPVFEKFYSSEELRTCKSCGHVMQPPSKT